MQNPSLLGVTFFSMVLLFIFHRPVARAGKRLCTVRAVGYGEFPAFYRFFTKNMLCNPPFYPVQYVVPPG